jgi:hypothetical protein
MSIKTHGLISRQHNREHDLTENDWHNFDDQK